MRRKTTRNAHHRKNHPTEADIDRTLAESFPASDPPCWTLGLEQAGAATDRQSKAGSDLLEPVIVTSAKTSRRL